MVTKDSLVIKKITISDLDLLTNFIQSSGDSLKTFRYYEKRDFKIISNHLLTILLFFNNMPIAYGHLEKEDDKIWLGIMVSESEKGKGYGKVIMSYLISFCMENKFSNIFLTVDKNNLNAIYLYQKFDFKIFSEFSESSLIMQTIV
jgi:GNAT superfamily N-acetyltransferase